MHIGKDELQDGLRERLGDKLEDQLLNKVADRLGSRLRARAFFLNTKFVLFVVPLRSPHRSPSLRQSFLSVRGKTFL